MKECLGHFEDQPQALKLKLLILVKAQKIEKAFLPFSFRPLSFRYLKLGKTI